MVYDISQNIPVFYDPQGQEIRKEHELYPWVEDAHAVIMEDMNVYVNIFRNAIDGANLRKGDEEALSNWIRFGTEPHVTGKANLLFQHMQSQVRQTNGFYHLALPHTTCFFPSELEEEDVLGALDRILCGGDAVHTDHFELSSTDEENPSLLFNARNGNDMLALKYDLRGRALTEVSFNKEDTYRLRKMDADQTWLKLEFKYAIPHVHTKGTRPIVSDRNHMFQKSALYQRDDTFFGGPAWTSLLPILDNVLPLFFTELRTHQKT